jgi:hypothetical protein
MADEVSLAKQTLLSAFNEEDDETDLFEARHEVCADPVPELTEEEKYVYGLFLNSLNRQGETREDSQTPREAMGK